MLSDGDLFGFALGLGESKPRDKNYDSHVESRNYSLSMENLMMKVMLCNIFLESIS